MIKPHIYPKRYPSGLVYWCVVANPLPYKRRTDKEKVDFQAAYMWANRQNCDRESNKLLALNGVDIRVCPNEKD